MESALRSRRNQAELLSTVGAAVLGAGVALLLERWLAPFAVLIAVVGLAVHAWGMFNKHRIESSEKVQRTPWEPYVYWTCWLVLAGLITYIAARAFT